MFWDSSSRSAIRLRIIDIGFRSVRSPAGPGDGRRGGRLRGAVGDGGRRGGFLEADHIFLRHPPAGPVAETADAGTFASASSRAAAGLGVPAA